MPKDIAGVMHEWGKGKLHSGGNGKVVKDQKQALAIAFAEQRRKKAKGGKAAAKLLGK